MRNRSMGPVVALLLVLTACAGSSADAPSATNTQPHPAKNVSTRNATAVTAAPYATGLRFDSTRDTWSTIATALDSDASSGAVGVIVTWP